MAKMLELALVMPVYNEEEIISDVISDWCSELDKLAIDYEVHAYNDGSKDDSLNVLNNLSKKFPKLVVHDKKNSGHGPTIAISYCQNSNAKWIFQVDSDNEMKAKYFKKLWAKRNEHDFLIGKRENRLQPLSRKIVSTCSRMLVFVFYGKGIHDVNSPYRLMSCNTFSNLFLLIPEDTFAPNVIVSGFACVKKSKIYEIPVPHEHRLTGQVSIKKWKLLKAAFKSFYQTILFRFKFIVCKKT